MEHHSQGIVDPLDFHTILEHQEGQGTKFTFIVPTDVTGQDAKLSMLTLKNQLRDAHAALLEQGMSESAASELLSPVSELLDDSSYWRLQSRSLVVFLTEGFCLPVRVPVHLAGRLTIGERFDLLSLAAVLASDSKLYILTLTKNSVRLFNSTRNTIEELPLENIPASFDEVITELPERVVDVRSGSAGPAGTPSFQGPDGDVDRVLLEQYIHAVGQAVGTRLGTARSQLLVLAAVAEYLPIFQGACPYPAIYDGVIPGNPEHTLPGELRSAAWRLVNSHVTEGEASEQDRASSVVHAGKGSFDLAEIAKAAEEGRVDTLYLPRDDAHLTDETVRELANRALFGTLKNSGVLRTLGEISHEAIATFRY